MPYNTTAIPPRKEVTGTAQLPLSRVKKIVAVDPDIQICSNNASFVITLAAEMFVQYLAAEGQNMVKLERKPRRNLQYKDLANAVLHKDNLEFLEDVIPKTTQYRQIKDQAAATQAKLRGEKTGDDPQLSNGKAQKPIANGSGSLNGFERERGAADEEPNRQLEMDVKKMEHGHDDDVDMMD